MISEKGINKSLSFIIRVAIAALLVIIYGCSENDREKAQPKAVPNVIQKGDSVLTLDTSAQDKSGIIVAPLKAVLHQEELQVYGTILQPEALIEIRNSYLSAVASADKAAAALDASRREYQRLKELNEDNRNISDKNLQAASAVLASNEADVSITGERLRAVKQTALAQWGGVVSEWVFHSAPELSRITELKEVLIRITIPSDKSVETAPGSINLEAPGPKLVSARFASRTPGADPLTQGIGFFYVAPSHASLIPGMNVRAVMPVGRKIRGVVIPLSAVVWFQGKAWTYVQIEPEHFARREVSTLKPVPAGYFVAEAFSPGEKVVIKGPQILLSQETRPSTPVGGENEEED